MFKRTIAVLALLLASVVAVPASAQYNTFDPSAVTSFRHGFWSDMGRFGARVTIRGLQYLTMPHPAPYPQGYVAPAGCQLGHICILETGVPQQMRLQYLGTIYVKKGEQPGGNVSLPAAPPAPRFTSTHNWTPSKVFTWEETGLRCKDPNQTGVETAASIEARQNAASDARIQQHWTCVPKS